MAKKIISLLIVFAIVFAGGYYTAIQLIPDSSEVNSGPTYATKPVTRGDLKVGINITGQLNANWGGSVFAPKPDGIEGTIKYVVEEVFVKENDEVKKDAPVMRLSASNLSEIAEENNKALEKKYNELSDIQKDIDSKTDKLGKKVNKNITSYEQVNPSDGIVISSPISGKLADLKVVEGERVSDPFIASVINDGVFKIPFRVSTEEYANFKDVKDVKLNYSGFEGYYDGKIIDLNPNPVHETIEKTNVKGEKYTVQVYVHKGTIEAKNPGLIPIGSSVGVYVDNGASYPVASEYSAIIESYLDQSKIYSTEYSDNEKTVLATEVFVKNSEIVKAGQAIVRIAGAGVTQSIEADINSIKAEYEKLRTKMEEIDNIKKGIANLMTFSEKLLVTAPNDGIVSWQRYNVGDTFEGSASSDQWTFEILNLYNSNQMSVYTEVSDLDVNYVQQGAKVDVTVDALPGKVFEGTVDRMYQYNRDGKVVYQVNISVIGGDGLRPGMSTNCFIDAGQSLDTLLVPIEAVFEEDFKQKVEILKEDGTVEAIEIEIGLMNDRYVEALSGIEEGQLVVTGSSGDLMPSQSVDNNNSIIPGKNK